MPVREVIVLPDPRLKAAAPPTDPRDPRLAALFTDLMDTLRFHRAGVGLAAVQIGVPLRAVVVDVSASPRSGENHGLLKLVNPVVAEASQWKKSREGCMSVPGLLGNVKRAQKIRLRATDEKGNPIEMECVGYESVAVQHEVDHLDGILFPDRVRSSHDLYERRSFDLSSPPVD
jgi:peptide deformylase